jgi:hypothetical protein
MLGPNYLLAYLRTYELFSYLPIGYVSTHPGGNYLLSIYLTTYPRRKQWKTYIQGT